jgi:cytochrome c-type biogenesis protein CcmH
MTGDELFRLELLQQFILRAFTATIMSAIGLGVAPHLLWAQKVHSPEVRKVSESLTCQCPCSYRPLSACNMTDCPSATPLREEIAAQLDQGKTEPEIIANFVAKYGKGILSSPPKHGFDLAAWILPFAALAIGLFVVYVIIMRWLRKPALAGMSPGLSGIPDAYRERIERELKETE